jgi:hypothetical protein
VSDQFLSVVPAATLSLRVTVDAAFDCEEGLQDFGPNHAVRVPRFEPILNA